MVVSLSMCVASSYYPGVGAFMTNIGVQIFALITLLFSMCALFVYRQTVPVNYWLLSVVTVSEGVSVASMTAHYEVASVLGTIAVLAVTLVCLFAGTLMIKDKANLVASLAISSLVASILLLFLLPFLLMNVMGQNY